MEKGSGRGVVAGGELDRGDAASLGDGRGWGGAARAEATWQSGARCESQRGHETGRKKGAGRPFKKVNFRWPMSKPPKI